MLKRMKILTISCLIVCSAPLQALSLENPLTQADQDIVLAMNYLTTSLVRIDSFNDRVILDQEYDQIINNLNLRKIHDEETVTLIQDMMGVITEFRISETDRNMLKADYENNVENSLYASISGIQAPFSANPAALVLLAVQVGSVASNYKNNLKQYRNQLKKSTWSIDKKDMREINSLRQSFIGNLWTILNRHNIPDSSRLTEKQISYYVDALKDKKTDRRLRKLLSIKTSFSKYPPFWYYLGQTYQELHQKTDAISSYKIFEGINSHFFRNNQLLAVVLLNHISLLDIIEQHDFVLNALKSINTESPLDGRMNLATSAIYTKLGMQNKALERLQVNIDNNTFVSLSMRLMGMIENNANRTQDLDATIANMVEDNRVHIQDILYLIGSASKKKILSQITPMVLGVNTHLKTNKWDPLSEDSLIVDIPDKWILTNLKQFKLKINHDGKSILKTPTILGSRGDHIVQYTFSDSFDSSKFIATNRSTKLTVSMLYNAGNYRLIYRVFVSKTKRDANKIEQINQKAHSLFSKAKGWWDSSDKKTKVQKKHKYLDKEIQFKLIKVETDNGYCLVPVDGILEVQECGKS